MFNAHPFAAAALVGLAAFATAAAHAAGTARDRVEVRLMPTIHNAGKSGLAVFHRSGDRTLLTLTVSALPQDLTRPVRLTSYLVQGSCENSGTAAALPLGDRAPLQSLIHPAAMAVYRGPARASYDLSLPFDSLLAAPFALSVRLGPADGGHEIFCGESPS